MEETRPPGSHSITCVPTSDAITGLCYSDPVRERNRPEEIHEECLSFGLKKIKKNSPEGKSSKEEWVPKAQWGEPTRRRPSPEGSDCIISDDDIPLLRPNRASLCPKEASMW